MIKKIKNYLTVLFAAAVLAAPFAAPVAVYAADDATGQIQGPLCNGASDLKFDTTAGDCDGVENSGDTLTNLIRTIINVISVVVGVVAVVMIVLGGLKYITSGGDSSNVSSAKNTIIYAVIGLVVVALAQFIVQFVLDKVTNAG